MSNQSMEKIKLTIKLLKKLKKKSDIRYRESNMGNTICLFKNC